MDLFLSGRYISSAEACWRIFGFPMRQLQPPVTLLQVHLSGEQNVVFQQGTPAAAVLAAHGNTAPATMLTQWFAMNADEAPVQRGTGSQRREVPYKGGGPHNEIDCSALLYHDYPMFFVWTAAVRRHAAA